MRRLLYVLAIIAGGLAAVGGVLVGLALAGVLLVSGWPGRAGIAPPGSGQFLQGATLALAIAVLGLGFGLLLIWAARRASANAPDWPARLPGWGWLLLGELVALGLGQIAASRLPVLLPLFHLVAGGLPALLFLSLTLSAARWRGGSLPARTAAASLAWGGVGGTLSAMVLEILLVLLAAVGLAAWLNISQPALAQELRTWAMGQFQSGGQPADLGPLLRLVRMPGIALLLLLGVGVGVPLVEEGSKALAVPLVALTGRPLTRLDGFLLGAAAGAGFTLVEGILNGSLALASTGTWAALMLVRGGTAAIHCLASGLTGLGWQSVLSRRWGRGIGYALLGLAVHGIWNAATIGTALASLQSALGGAAGQILLAGLQLLALLVMATLWLVVVLALPLIARHLAGPAGAVSPPPAALPVAGPADPDPAGNREFGAPATPAAENAGSIHGPQDGI